MTILATIITTIAALFLAAGLFLLWAYFNTIDPGEASVSGFLAFCGISIGLIIGIIGGGLFVLDRFV